VPHAPYLRVGLLTLPVTSPLHFSPRSAGRLPAFLTLLLSPSNAARTQKRPTPAIKSTIDIVVLPRYIIPRSKQHPKTRGKPPKPAASRASKLNTKEMYATVWPTSQSVGNPAHWPQQSTASNPPSKKSPRKTKNTKNPPSKNVSVRNHPKRLFSTTCERF